MLTRCWKPSRTPFRVAIRTAAAVQAPASSSANKPRQCEQEGEPRRELGGWRVKPHGVVAERRAVPAADTIARLADGCEHPVRERSNNCGAEQAELAAARGHPAAAAIARIHAGRRRR